MVWHQHREEGECSDRRGDGICLDDRRGDSVCLEGAPLVRAANARISCYGDARGIPYVGTWHGGTCSEHDGASWWYLQRA